MSDLTNIAHQAEKDLNSYQKKQGVGKQSLSSTNLLFSFPRTSFHTLLIYHQTTTATESGVNQNVEKDFPGAEVRYGEMANHGGSGSKKIPPSEGGDFDARGR